jgi:hypothetical protein
LIHSVGEDEDYDIEAEEEEWLVDGVSPIK